MRAALDDVGAPAARPGGAAATGGRAGAGHREERDVGPDAAGDRGHERVVGVEDDPAVGLRDPGDHRLDLGQLGQRVDALEVEVVGADVREDAGVVRLVADAAQEDPAARRLEHGDVDVAAAEDCRRAAGPGPVACLDEPLVDEDRRPRSSCRRGGPRAAGCA